MRIGLALGLGSFHGGGAAALDPATESLTTWLRDYGGSSPWNGTASAGSSGTNNWSEATNPPSAGTALNSFGTASFNGTNKLLTSSANSQTIYTASAYGGWALVNATSVATNNANLYDNDTILMTSSNSAAGVTLKSTGTACVYHFDGTDFVGITTSFSIGSWQLIQWKYDGTNQKIRVNNGAWQSVARANISTLSGQNFVLGRNAGTTRWFNGLMADVGTWASAPSDAKFDELRGYINSRYALAI